MGGGQAKTCKQTHNWKRQITVNAKKWRPFLLWLIYHLEIIKISLLHIFYIFIRIDEIK